MSHFNFVLYFFKKEREKVASYTNRDRWGGGEGGMLGPENDDSKKPVMPFHLLPLRLRPNFTQPPLSFIYFETEKKIPRELTLFVDTLICWI
jgi:hypothetical protein